MGIFTSYPDGTYVVKHGRVSFRVEEMKWRGGRVGWALRHTHTHVMREPYICEKKNMVIRHRATG